MGPPRIMNKGGKEMTIEGERASHVTLQYSKDSNQAEQSRRRHKSAISVYALPNNLPHLSTCFY